MLFFRAVKDLTEENLNVETVMGRCNSSSFIDYILVSC